MPNQRHAGGNGALEGRLAPHVRIYGGEAGWQSYPTHEADRIRQVGSEAAAGHKLLPQPSPERKNVRPFTGGIDVTLLKASDVFVPGGLPQATYIARKDLRLEDRLLNAAATEHRLITLTGPTKSGKTVLARKIFPENQAIWINSGSLNTEDELWSIVVDRLGYFTSHEVNEAQITEATIEASGSVGSAVPGLKAEFHVTPRLQQSRSSGKSHSRTLPAKTTALKGLSDLRVPLVIDDFHYLPREVQGSVVRAIKPLVFDPGLSRVFRS